jgi:hypothetical protein
MRHEIMRTYMRFICDTSTENIDRRYYDRLYCTKGKPLCPFYLQGNAKDAKAERADAVSQSGGGEVRTLSDILHLLG